MTDSGKGSPCFDEGTITVKRSVHQAAALLTEAEKTDKRDLTDWNLAEEKRDQAREAGDNKEADFWHEVYEYLMCLSCVSSKVSIKIVG